MCAGRERWRLAFRGQRSGSPWCCATPSPTPKTHPHPPSCHRGRPSCSTAILTPLKPPKVNLILPPVLLVSLRLHLGLTVLLFAPPTAAVDRADGASSPEHASRPPPEAPACAPPCAPPMSPPSPSPGAPGWEREVVCIQPSRSTSTPENAEPPPEEAHRKVGLPSVPFAFLGFVLQPTYSCHDDLSFTAPLSDCREMQCALKG